MKIIETQLQNNMCIHDGVDIGKTFLPRQSNFRDIRETKENTLANLNDSVQKFFETNAPI